MTELFGAVGILENCWHYFIFGVIQGLTEFLPISSTAHLKVLPVIFGWNDPGVSVTATIQLGSIFAIIMYFREDLKHITKGILNAIFHSKWTDDKAQVGLAVLQGTIPIALTGLLIKVFWSEFGNSSLRSIPSIAIVSIVMAFLLFYAESIGVRKKTIKGIKSKDGLWIGIGQMLAIIPGVSRSGITLTTALIYGFKREDAARFSFLLGIPAITIAGLVEFKNALSIDLSFGFLPLIIGIITSTIVSLVSIDWLIKFLQKRSTKIFIIYRLLFGITSLLWWSKYSYN